MVNYRRKKSGNPNDIYFLTLVCANHFPFFNDIDKLDLVKNAMKQIRIRDNVRFKAWVIIPDHIHFLIFPGKSDYSKIVASFKRSVSASMKRRGFLKSNAKLWQDRFWEHSIRDENDLNNCLEYIHYNPVKHGLTGSPFDWKYSSFSEYVIKGIYNKNWAEGERVQIEGSEFD